MEYCVSACESDDDFYDVMESKIMQMTFWAHKQVLFEKIKARIEATEGEKLDKIAEIVVDASAKEWSSGREAERKRQELRDKLKETYEEP